MCNCTWIWLHILSLSLSFLYKVSCQEDTLKLVQILYRHGDRTPWLKSFPSDVNNGPSTWYNGIGELTPTGMRQHYQLGSWFREKYAEYLNTTFDQTQIYVRSTDVNRTIMSALCNLAGLYPPVGIQNWSNNIPWQPIPVHSRDKSNDIWLHRNDTDPHRPPMMSWLNQSVIDTIIHLGDLKWEYWDYGSHDINRLRGGPLLGDIMNRMDAKRNNTLDHRLKIYFYSAHDSTVVSLFKAMGVAVTRAVPYACAVIIELYETATGQWTVKTSFKNDTNEFNMGGPAHDVTVGNCPSPCSLDQFIKRSRSVVPNDWYAECGLKHTSSSNRGSISSVMYTILCTAVGFLMKNWK